MDSKGRWIDNVFIERLWRSVKYENIYLRAYETGTQLRRGLTEYFDFYNSRCIHEALGYATPDEVYFAGSLLSWQPRHDRKIRCRIDFPGYPR